MSHRSAWLTPLVLAAALLAACGPRRDFEDAGMDSTIGDTSTCPPDKLACGSLCVDQNTDHDHCGTCGNACHAYEVCQAGACVTGCPSGQQACGDVCATLDSDHDHCGTCDTACSADQVCSSGHCVAQCPGGFTRCTARGGDAGTGTYCADFQTDRTNCGGCSTVCGSGYDCISGRCTLRCPTGLQACAGRCIDPQSDHQNCGACGNACMGSDVCTDGMCASTCVTGQTNCAGRCIDPMRDTANCGGCGMACPAGQVCTGGMCGITCATGETLCTDHCVDAQTNRFNCGACGHACDPGQFCTAGACTLICPIGTTACGGQCVNLTTDSANCGACGAACGAGQFCSGGACVMACQAGQSLCSGLCADTQVDSNNCGNCGVVCTTGYACLAGLCQPLTGTDAGSCDPPSSMCGGRCLDTRSDNSNCGTCGTPCAVDHTCVMGMCVAPCATGQGRCGLTCTDVQFDSANCGVCGHACPTGQTCVRAACVVDPTLQVGTLSTTGCHFSSPEDGTAGDDRGGIAVSPTKVFYTGDMATVSLNASDLTGLVSVGRQHDGLVNDLSDGTVYVLLDASGTEVDNNTFFSTFIATQLGVVDGTTGMLTATHVALSAPITFTTNDAAPGIFSGRGRALFFTGSNDFSGNGVWMEVRLPSGQVTTLGTFPAPSGSVRCENWATWGIEEYFGGQRYADYVSESDSPGVGIVRYRPSDGMATVLSAMPDVGDMCSFTLSTSLTRWYFHYEATPSWGTGNEIVGYCPATFTTP